MDLKDAFADIERRAISLRLPLYKLCEHAGIAASTAYRWRAGAGPSLSAIGKLERTLDRLEASK